MSNEYLNPFNNISNTSSVTTINSVSSVDASSDASVMTNNSYYSLNYTLSASDLTEENIELIKKELERKIQEQKNNLENTKNTRGWATSAWNGIKGWFGGGDKKTEKNIANYEELLASLNSDVSNISEVYKTIMGSDLDLASLQTLQNSKTIANSIDPETKSAIVAELENQIATLESKFETAKNSNGWISGTWNGFKNWTGIGASSNKSTAEISDLKEQVAKLKNGEADLASTYKNITGSDLNYDNLYSLLSGEEGTGLDSISVAGKSVNNYSEGQKMCVDVVGDIVSGIAAVGAVTLGTAIGICAAPFTAGASLGMVAAGFGIATGIGAAVKTAIKASDCIGNEKKYTLKDFGYDVITGGLNGAAAPITNALGGAAGTSVMKACGQEALETTIKSSALTSAKEIGKEALEEIAEQTSKKVISSGLAKTLSFSANSMVDGSLSGFIDGSSRALAEGRYEDILSDGLEGFAGGLIASPIMGAGFNFAGKAGSKIGQSALGQATGRIIQEGTQAIGNKIDNILPQGVKRVIKETGEKINDKFIQTSLKNCLTISDDNVYSVKLNGYNVQLIEDELSEEILEEISKGDNTLIFKYAQDVLNMELRKEELAQYFLMTWGSNDEILDPIITLDDVQYAKAKELIKSETDIKNISNAISNLDPSLHAKALDMIANGTEGCNINSAVVNLDPSLHAKALDMITNGTGDGIKKAIEDLDPSLHAKALDMLEAGFKINTIKKLINLDASQYIKVQDIITNGTNINDVIYITQKLDPSLHAKALDLLDKGINKSVISSVAQADESLYLKIINTLEGGKSNQDINTAIWGLDTSAQSKALDLLSNYDATTANCLAIFEPSQYDKVLKLSETLEGVHEIKIATENINPDSYAKVLDMLEKGTKAIDINNISEFDPSLHAKALDLLEKNYKNIPVAVQLDETRYSLLIDLLNKDKSGIITVIANKPDVTSLSAALDMYSFLQQNEGLSNEALYNILDCWTTEIKQPLTITNMNIFSHVATADINPQARELLLCKLLDLSDNDIKFSKLTLIEKLEKIDILKTLQTSDIFTTEEKNFLNIDNEIKIIQEHIENAIEVTPVSKETIEQMMGGFFANNNPQLDNLLSTTDFTNFGKQGLPLEYSRASFLDDLSDILKNVPENEKTDILNKLDISLTIENGNIGYNGIINLNKLSDEGVEGEVLAIAKKFILENSISTGNNELDKALNSLIQGMPEFMNIIGKQQHTTHDFSVDIHMLTVLKEAMSNPNYQNLSNEDKFCLKLATMLHDIAKSEGVVDGKHADICALYARDILRKFHLSTKTNDRIYELIKNHHWLADYNQGTAKADRSASLFRRANDLEIAQIIAEADLKGVKADGSFYELHKKALDENMQKPVQNALIDINSQGQMFLTNEIIDSSKIPAVEYNGQKYKIIDFRELAKDTDLQQFGFEPGTTVDNLRLFIHMTRTPEIVYTLKDPSYEGLLCASYVSAEFNPTYSGLKYGVSLKSEQVNIANASSTNQSSGFKKDFLRFSNTIIGQDESMSQFRSLIPQSIKTTLGISDEEYSKLFAQIQKFRSISNLDYTPEIKIGEKTFTGKQIKEAILKADDLMLESGRLNEANLYSPKINAVVAKVNSISEIQQEFLDFAQKHNLPIYLLGE